MDPDNGRIYVLSSSTAWVLYSFGLLSALIGLMGVGTRHPGFLVPPLVGVILIYFGRKVRRDHARFEKGVYTRYSGERVVEEFDLRRVEDWSLEASRDSDGFNGATLHCTGPSPNPVFKIDYGDNRDLFRDLLVFLRLEKKGLTRTDVPALAEVFPSTATEIKALLKNW